jgi:hypothetical protein
MVTEVLFQPFAFGLGVADAVTLSAATTANVTELLEFPPTFTTTASDPIAAPLGTVATTCVVLQEVAVAEIPPTVTVLLLCVVPKPVPLIVNASPIGWLVGLRVAMCGSTVNATPLLACVETVTTTFPVVAAAGTVTTSLVVLQLVAVAAAPLKVTVLLPCVLPKFEPLIVTDVPVAPEVGEIVLMLGGGITVNETPLLATPPAAVTTTLPVVAPVGTEVVICVALHVLTVAAVPLNVILPLPWVGPKLDPLMVTAAPIIPELGTKLLMLGAGVTVNVTPLLATPPAAVTTTFPVVAPVGTLATICVALQVVIVAVVPLNVTLPVPCVGPKFEPAITMDDPTAPVFGVSELIFGGEVTVKSTPLLATPLTVTTTFPVVAPVGTVAFMLVELKLVMVALVPLNVTVSFAWVEPKLLPAITTVEPTAPVLGVRLLMTGAAATANNGNNSWMTTRAAACQNRLIDSP